jgi:hypothetical protein
MASAKTRGQGKTSFVKEILIDNPMATSKVVNEAWNSAGMEGTISDTLVNKMRAQLGFAGNLRGKRQTKNEAAVHEETPTTSKKRGRKQRNGSPTRGEPRSAGKGMRTTSRTDVLVELEADLDRLLFKVMNLGGLADVENSLRETRRILYRDFSRSR